MLPVAIIMKDFSPWIITDCQAQKPTHQLQLRRKLRKAIKICLVFICFNEMNCQVQIQSSNYDKSYPQEGIAQTILILGL